MLFKINIKGYQLNENGIQTPVPLADGSLIPDNEKHFSTIGGFESKLN
jgi:hypothetical protein